MIRLITAAVLATAVPALADERNFPVSDFHGLALAGSPDVTLTTGRAASVHAVGAAAALDRLEIRVENGTLKIGNKRGLDWSWRDQGPVRIAVTVPMIRSIDVTGSGNVKADVIKVKDFTGAISGSGNIDIVALDADMVSLAIAGSGDISATGRCGAGTAKIAGSGDMKLDGLKCATLSASIAGSGNIRVVATQTANLSMIGSGDITLTGGARCTVSSAGSGKARCS